MASVADAVTGSLLGLALGDALGFLVEGESPEVARAYAAGLLRASRSVERPPPGDCFGQYSDDSQLARELLASLVDAGGMWRADAFAARLARLFERGADVGAGPGTRTAALRIAQGAPWSVAATPEPYAGNGTAMRVGPLGVLYARHPALLRQVAAEQSAVTHRDPRCAAGAIAIAGAAALVSTTPSLDPRVLLETLADWTRSFDPPTAIALGKLLEWTELRPEEAAGRIHGLGLAAGPDALAVGFTPFVTTTVLWSLYAFLRSPDDYLQAVATAIAGGGDTDTMAAMTGAVAGARLGREALPARWVERLEDRGEWRAAELEALARRAAAASEAARRG